VYSTIKFVKRLQTAQVIFYNLILGFLGFWTIHQILLDKKQSKSLNLQISTTKSHFVVVKSLTTCFNHHLCLQFLLQKLLRVINLKLSKKCTITKRFSQVRCSIRSNAALSLINVLILVQICMLIIVGSAML
jgi:hypothetical protein